MPFPAMYDINDPKITQTMAKDVDEDFEDKSFWTTMSGNDSRYPIFTKLQANTGEVKRKFLNTLLGDGVQGNTDFNKNEDKLTYLSMSITQNIFANSTTSEDTRIEQHIKGNSFLTDAAGALADWRRREFDRTVFASLSHNCTNIAAFSRASPTGLYSITNGQRTQDLCQQIQGTDTFNLRSLNQALQHARLGIDHYGNPHPKVRPYRINTKNVEGQPITLNVLIAILHPMQVAALYNDPDFVEIQARANERGMNNPLLSGQIGMINGCIILDGGAWDDEIREAGILTSKAQDIEKAINEREKVDRGGVMQMSAYAGDANGETACGLLLGGTSMLLCSNFKSQIRIEDTDMGRKKRVGIDVFYGMRKTHYTGYTDEEKKSLYHGKDFSCMALVSAI